jgi:hypothetical protein
MNRRCWRASLQLNRNAPIAHVQSSHIAQSTPEDIDTSAPWAVNEGMESGTGNRYAPACQFEFSNIRDRKRSR